MPIPTDAADVLAPSRDEVSAAREIEAKLHASPDAPVVLTVRVDGEEHRLSGSTAEFFKAVIREVARGHPVGLIDLDEELSTTEAAEFLGVSRPTLIGLLKDGQIPHRMVGTHRRVRQGPLFEYRKRFRARLNTPLEDRLRATEHLLRDWHAAE
jgi:excisionase family DNA binding protein